MLSKTLQVSFLVSFVGCTHFGAVFLVPLTTIMLYPMAQAQLWVSHQRKFNEKN